MVPCTWVAPASTAASELATAQPVSLWQWMPEPAPGGRHAPRAPCRRPAGQHPAVGVAQRDDLGPGLGGEPHHLERVLAVGSVAVEEVLGVEEDPPPLGAQEGDRVADHREVLGQRRAQRELDVADVGLGDQRDHGGPAVAQRRDLGVVGGPYAGPAGRAERGEPALRRSSSSRARAKNSVSLGIAPGQPPSMKPTPSSSSWRAIASLSATESLQPLLLRAVAQGGVVDVERALQVHRVRPGPRAARGAGAQTKRPPVGTGGLRVGECPDALGDDDGAAHRTIVTRTCERDRRISRSDRPRCEVRGSTGTTRSESR